MRERLFIHKSFVGHAWRSQIPRLTQHDTATTEISTTKRNARFSRLAASIFCLLFAVGVSAQVKTDTANTSGQPAVETQVERGAVVTVNGNDLIVKMEDGSLRHFANVPESAKVTVDGKELGIHDLKPGEVGATITTTTT